ncbi:MAG: hypothetical protein DHS20C20_27290 [Ardenticatenaceae bacterium]|nr:MAG: hypothetical protein DHS20C20_27290 [Ardenticatenaceae bacterium]
MCIHKTKGSKDKAAAQTVCHTRVGGYPRLTLLLDSRIRGNDTRGERYAHPSINSIPNVTIQPFEQDLSGGEPDRSS